ncbi:MAG: aspartyl protease family protein [Pirellulales bacterium]|nr:aspartyl protease family protein [Pirellulales bacterium]
MPASRWLRILQRLSSGARRGCPHAPFGHGNHRRRPLGRFEPLEPRTLLSANAIDLGPGTDLYDQPYVEVELFDGSTGLGPYGSVWGFIPYNYFVLDTGANSVLSAREPTLDLVSAGYQTEGTFLEYGVAGASEFDVSAAYRFDFRGSDGVTHTLPQTDDAVRILSSEDLELGGPLLWGGVAGVVGMPAMAGRVTTLDMSGWADGSDLALGVEFAQQVPPDQGLRYSVAVDDRVAFDPRDGLPPGSLPDDPLPVWAPVPMMTGVAEYRGNRESGTFLFDTGAQKSMISSSLAFAIGLDEDCDGNFDNEMIGTLPVGGIGGTIDAPVMLIDALCLPTLQGPDLRWADTEPEALGVEVIVLDLHPDIQGLIGIDLLTSGMEINEMLDFIGGPYFDQIHFDFRDMMEGSGVIHFDLHPYRGDVAESGGSTHVVEGGAVDTYQIALKTRPTANVRIDLGTPDGQVAAVDDAHPTNTYLIFTPSNWNLPQQVRVTAFDDAIPEGLHTAAVTHQVSSNDDLYDGIHVRYVAATVAESDAAEVVGRQVFYNNSTFDGDDPRANGHDDCAIAPDKQALLPGQTATFANYTSYHRGLNGLMIDVAGLTDADGLGPDDFLFRVGNDEDPAGWVLAPPPREIAVRPGMGLEGSDRVEVVWDDFAISKQWLQVSVLPTANTGLAQPDVFYFGNAVAEAGNSTLDAKVNATDMLLARNNPRTFLAPAPVDFAYDFNRDARVNATDMLLARNNPTHFLNALRLISVPSEKSADDAAGKSVTGDMAAGQDLQRRSVDGATMLSRLLWQYELEATLQQSASADGAPGEKAAGDVIAWYWL